MLAAPLAISSLNTFSSSPAYGSTSKPKLAPLVGVGSSNVNVNIGPKQSMLFMSMFDDNDADGDDGDFGSIDLDLDFDGVDVDVDDDTEMQILYSTPYPPLQIQIPVPSSPSPRPLSLPAVSATPSKPSSLSSTHTASPMMYNNNNNTSFRPAHQAPSPTFIVPIPALPPHLNPLRAQKLRRPCFPLRRRVGTSPLKREVKEEDLVGDEEGESTSGSGSGSESGGSEHGEDVAMEVDEVAYFAPPGLPPPSSRPASPPTEPASESCSSPTPGISLTPDVTRAMQDFHATISRSLTLLSPTSPVTISPSDKSHTIAQISRCIFIIQSRIDELGEIICVASNSNLNSQGWFGRGAVQSKRGAIRDVKEMLMEKQLLEVELCGMESVWREVRGRLVGTRGAGL